MLVIARATVEQIGTGAEGDALEDVIAAVGDERVAALVVVECVVAGAAVQHVIAAVAGEKDTRGSIDWDAEAACDCRRRTVQDRQDRLPPRRTVLAVDVNLHERAAGPVGDILQMPALEHADGAANDGVVAVITRQSALACQRVVALPARQRVVIAEADQRVMAIAADQRADTAQVVVADAAIEAAVDTEIDELAKQHVIAGIAGDRLGTKPAVNCIIAVVAVQHVDIRTAADAVIAATAKHSIVTEARSDRVVAAIAAQQVGAVEAVDDVVAIATGNRVMTGAAGQDVVAGADRRDRVIATAAQHDVVAKPASQRVVAIATGHAVVEVRAEQQPARRD